MATPSLPVATIKCPWAYLGLKKTLTEKNFKGVSRLLTLTV